MFIFWQVISWSEASPIKPLPSYDDLVAAKSYLDQITTDPLKVLSNRNGLSYTVFFRLKTLQKTYVVFAKILAISDADDRKLKEKSLFGMDPSSFIKLRGLKVIPKESDKSNVMKLFLPRNKPITKPAKSDIKNVNNKSDEEQTVASILEQSGKDLQKDFIEVDDILLVRDPSSIETLLGSQLSNEDSKVSTSEPIVVIKETKSNSKPDQKARELLFNKSLRYRKLTSGRDLGKQLIETADRMAENLLQTAADRLLKSTKDRELFKREDTNSKKIADIPMKDDTFTQKEAESVGDSLQSTKDNVEVTTTVESVKSDDNSKNIESETQSTATERVETVGDSRVTDESDMLGAAQANSRTESSNDETKKAAEIDQEQTTPSNGDSTKSDNNGMVGEPMQEAKDEIEASKDDVQIAAAAPSEVSKSPETEAPKTEPNQVSSTLEVTNRADETVRKSLKLN